VANIVRTLQQVIQQIRNDMKVISTVVLRNVDNSWCHALLLTFGETNASEYKMIQGLNWEWQTKSNEILTQTQTRSDAFGTNNHKAPVKIRWTRRKSFFDRGSPHVSSTTNKNTVSVDLPLHVPDLINFSQKPIQKPRRRSVRIFADELAVFSNGTVCVPKNKFLS
jgi:hypothetical protein